MSPHEKRIQDEKFQFDRDAPFIWNIILYILATAGLTSLIHQFIR